ncbi:hypothetical protein [Nonomuraea sp. NPDC002799]
MLKEACAISALVAATLVPSAAAQANAAKVRTADTPTSSTSLGDCASSRNADCKWYDKGNKRCLFCKKKKGGWKKQHCEQKEHESTETECKTTTPDPAMPKRTCRVCVNQKGKQVSKECSTAP